MTARVRSTYWKDGQVGAPVTSAASLRSMGDQEAAQHVPPGALAQPTRQQHRHRTRWGPSRSQRSSYPCQMTNWILARLKPALRLPFRTEGSVRQFSCTIHVQLKHGHEAGRRLGRRGNFGRSTKTNHSCSDAATGLVTPGSGHDVRAPTSVAA